MSTKTGVSPRKGRRSETMSEVTATSTTTTNNNNDSNNNNAGNSITNSTTQKAGSNPRLPSIKQRRPSVPKKSRGPLNDESPNTTSPRQESSTTTAATTTTSTASTTSVTAPSTQRRPSVPQSSLPPATQIRRGSRPTFAGIGRRVSSMVKARLAFQGRGRSSSRDSENEPNHMEHIHEMPRSPRFSTFLSAEAQYAMMKGYEDKLYEKIAYINPESRLTLKRNKTPFHKKISIVDNDSSQGGADGADSPEDKSLLSSGYSSLGGTPSTTGMSPIPDLGSETSPSRSEALPSPFLRPLRSQSVVGSSDVTKSHPASLMTKASHHVTGGFALHRSSSLATLREEGLSLNKRLVLTYRLESAMDILDTIKRRNKENSLSPRVFRIPRQVDAVRDFNSWTKVWNKEFKEVQAK